MTNPTIFDIMKEDPMQMAQLNQSIRATSQRAAAETALAIAQQQNNPLAFKETSLTVPGYANIYGRFSIFDACSAGDIIGLQVATHGFMQWLGWRPNKYYRRRVDFISWWGPSGTAAGSPVSMAGAPCADPTTWEYGKAGYELLHTSWYHLGGDALDPHTVVQERCETSPRYRLNGRLISDDVEWQMNGIENVLAQGIKRDLVHGSHANAYEMDGLENIIKTGFTDDGGNLTPMLDSILVNWANDDLDGAVNGFGNFFEYLDEVVTEIEFRAQGRGGIAERDMVLLTSRFMATCLLDSYACYTTCGVTNSNDITDQALRGQQRAERRALNGGPLYDGNAAVGFLHLKSGRRIPIIVEDALDISKGSSSSYCTDIYLLTRRIGSMDVLYGEYLDMRTYENRVRRYAPDFSVRADQAGRFALKHKEDNWCISLQMGTSTELYYSAPWAQARFSNVCCGRQRQPLVGDPYQPQYLPGGSNLYPAWGAE